jgi:metal-sulfur cluster biosynthetic enzyme
VRDILRQVIDPEVGLEIVALGLIYTVEVAPGNLVNEITMTVPACPMDDMIVSDVHAALAKVLPATIDPDIRLIWEPPWNPAVMDQATIDVRDIILRKLYPLIFSTFEHLDAGEAWLLENDHDPKPLFTRSKPNPKASLPGTTWKLAPTAGWPVSANPSLRATPRPQAAAAANTNTCL